MSSHVLNNAGLDYIERPATQPAKGLLILLHGVGANERSLLSIASHQAEDIHVVLARAPIVMGPDGYGFFQVRFGPQGPVINPQQAESSRQALIEFVATLQSRTDIEPRKTLIGGFSQGGIMSASVALTSPSSVAGFGLFSGRILPEIEPLIPADIGQYPLNALVTHGRYDSKLPFFLAERSDKVLTQLGVRHKLKAYPCDHEITDEMLRDMTQWVNENL